MVRKQVEDREEAARGCRRPRSATRRRWPRPAKAAADPGRGPGRRPADPRRDAGRDRPRGGARSGEQGEQQLAEQRERGGRAAARRDRRAVHRSWPSADRSARPLSGDGPQRSPPSTASWPTSTRDVDGARAAGEAADGACSSWSCVGVRAGRSVVLYRYVRAGRCRKMVRGPPGARSSSRSTRAEEADPAATPRPSSASSRPSPRPARRPPRSATTPGPTPPASARSCTSRPSGRSSGSGSAARSSSPPSATSWSAAAGRDRRAGHAAGRADGRRVAGRRASRSAPPSTGSSTSSTACARCRDAAERSRRRRRQEGRTDGAHAAVGQPGVAGRGRASGSTRRSTPRPGTDLGPARRRPVRGAAAAGRRADRAAPAPGRPGRAGRVPGPGWPTGCSTARSAAAALDIVSELVVGALVAPVDLVEALEALARRAAARRWPRRRHASTTSRTSCSGSAGSWTASRGWPRCSPTTSTPGRQAGRAAARGARRQGHAGHRDPAGADRAHPRGRSLDRAAEELSELAAARRDRYVAHVRTAGAAVPGAGAAARRAR